MGQTALPSRLFGVTLDDVSEKEKIYKALNDLKTNNPNAPLPIIRIVFNVSEGGVTFVQPDYLDFIARVKRKKLAYIMGEIIDSADVYYLHYSSDPVGLYRRRTESYLNALGDLVDLWEIGNEVNGEWVGWYGEEDWKDKSVTAEDMLKAQDITAHQIEAAYQVIKKAGKQTAVTFYFNDDGANRHSWTDDLKNGIKYGEDYAMLKWAGKYRHLFPDVDYVFISYYQDDTYFGERKNRKPIIPGFEQWAKIFQELHGFYPKAKLGFGEVSPQCYYKKRDNKCKLYEGDSEEWEELKDKEKCSNRGCECCKKAQPEYNNCYYIEWDKGIRNELKKSNLDSLYVGGYFYWYFTEDVVNQKNSETIKAFQEAFAQWYQK